MSRFEPEAFGKYFLVDKIATGGMAEIFKAKAFGHGGFENLVVIKRILGHLGENEEFVEMFVDEAKVSVALQHANIVRVYDFGKVFDNYFIAMECVDGKDVRGILRKLARKRRYLPIDFAVYIAHEVCRGLAYAHTKTDLRGHPFGIVHRDMSPSNVLVSYEGDIKIADFGIAKAEQNTYNTADGVLKGKFEYMSPEQARGEQLDARSDLFSVGIILYEMLTGRRLFKGESDVATLEAIKAAEVGPPSAVTPRVPEALDRIVLRALSADREDRYPSAAALQEELHALLDKPLDTTSAELAAFMRDLFAEDIASELARLERGSEVAAVWREEADESLWDGHTGSTATLRQDPPPDRRRGLALMALAVILFLIVGAVGATAAALVTSREAPPTATAPAAPGRLAVTVQPAARIVVDDAIRGEGTSLLLDDLEPGTHVVRLEVDGREPYERTIEVTPEGLVDVDYTFPAPEPEPEPADADGRDEPVEPAPSEARPAPRASSPPRRTAPSGPARVSFTSTPAGATVVVDGRTVGTTPFTWTGSPGGRHAVELRKAGYEAVQGTLSELRAGRTTRFARTLAPAASEPGTVTVGIIGGGWGHVYVDGQQQDQPAPGRFQIPAGTHEIRVVNEGLGLDHREKVTVTAGASVRVNARP
jgi:serine/threonine protein kinase